jgi:serine/threonine-protein kinase
MTEGRPEQACPKFEQSQALEPGIGTLINLARCYARLGRTAKAWTAYRAAASQAHDAGQTKRESVARAQADALEPRLLKVQVYLPDGLPPPGFELLLDGAPWPEGLAGGATVVDPGARTVIAHAPGFVDQSERLEGSAGEQVELHLAPLHAVPKAPVPALAPREPAASQAQLAPADTQARYSKVVPMADSDRSQFRSNTGPLRTLGLVVGSAGIAGLGVGIGFGLRAWYLNDKSRENEHCEAGIGCDPDGLALNRSALRAADVSTVFLLSGAALSAAGVTLYLLGGSSARSSVSLELLPGDRLKDANLLVRGKL